MAAPTASIATTWIFVVLTPPAAFTDHRLDPGDILSADFQQVCVSP